MTPARTKSQRHRDLFAMVRATGHTQIPPFREPSLHEIYGHERSRVTKIQFIPRDLQ